MKQTNEQTNTDEKTLQDKTLKEFLKDSPYSKKEIEEFTVYLDGLLAREPNEHNDFISLMGIANNTNSEVKN